MKNLYDSKGYQIMTKIMEMLVLNLLFVFTCLPLVTFGPALKSLNGTWFKLQDGSGIPVWKLYFTEFFENFPQTFISGVLLLSGLLISYLGAALTGQMPVKIICYVIMIFLALFTLHFFPILSRFDIPMIRAAKNSLAMIILFFPQSVMLLLFAMTPYWILILFSKLFIYLVPIYMCLLFSLIAFVQTKCQLQMYEKMGQKKETAK